MKLALRQGFAIGALLAAMIFSPFAAAFTMVFNNNSGIYTGDNGLVGIVTPSTQSLTYNPFFGGGIGVGPAFSNVGPGEYLDILFNQRILLDQVLLSQWADPLGILIRDLVVFSFPENPGVSPALRATADSTTAGVGTFERGGIAVDGIRLRNPMRDGERGWFLQRINYSETPVPATVWLVGCALLALGSVTRKRA